MPDQDQAQLQERANRLAWDFIENYGITSMIFGTTYDVKGHLWVRSSEWGDENPDLLYFCPWCGVHRIEVDNYKDDPPCPAIKAAFELRGVAKSMERFRASIEAIEGYDKKEGEADGSSDRQDPVS